MAKVEPMGFVGRSDNLIHYRIGNQYYVRAAPRKFKQTKATKARAVEFGLASRIGSTIRRQLFPVIPDPRGQNHAETSRVCTLSMDQFKRKADR